MRALLTSCCYPLHLQTRVYRQWWASAGPLLLWSALWTAPPETRKQSHRLLHQGQNPWLEFSPWPLTSWIRIETRSSFKRWLFQCSDDLSAFVQILHFVNTLQNTICQKERAHTHWPTCLIMWHYPLPLRALMIHHRTVSAPTQPAGRCRDAVGCMCAESY